MGILNNLITFINDHFEDTNNYNKNLLFLKKLSIIMSEYNIDNVVEIKYLITKSRLLRNSLKVVIDKYGKVNLDNLYIELLFDVYSNIYEISFLEKDSYNQYLNEIGMIPLLTNEEEKNLAIRSKNGDLSARKLLVEHNLRLVVSVSKEYYNLGISKLDLIQEGNIGLMKAAEMYDVSKGYKFSTYATYWIKQKILNALNTKIKTIKIPSKVNNKIRYILKAKNELMQELFREPTMQELAEYLNMDIKKVMELELLSYDAISTNILIKENSEKELEEFIESKEKSLEDTVVDKLLKYDLVKILETTNLSVNQKKIIEMRFGLGDNNEKTLKEISEELNVTYDSAKTIESRALCKIRNQSKKFML